MTARMKNVVCFTLTKLREDILMLILDEIWERESTHGEYIYKIYEVSHGGIFKFLLHLDKNGEKEIVMTRVTIFYPFDLP